MSSLSKIIDHAVLQPMMTDKDLEEGCALAAQYQVATVFVKPADLKKAIILLDGHSTTASTVVGFPHGNNTTETKVFEAENGIKNGAAEIDMVCNFGKALSGDWEFVRNDIGSVLKVCHNNGKILKVIFENCYLEDTHKIKLCEICNELGVDFVKTSTGFGTEGATFHDVELMRKHCSPKVQIKASGGIRDLKTFLKMVDLGATRIGTSSIKTILDEASK